MFLLVWLATKKKRMCRINVTYNYINIIVKNAISVINLVKWEIKHSKQYNEQEFHMNDLLIRYTFCEHAFTFVYIRHMCWEEQ